MGGGVGGAHGLAPPNPAEAKPGELKPPKLGAGAPQLDPYKLPPYEGGAAIEAQLGGVWIALGQQLGVAATDPYDGNDGCEKPPKEGCAAPHEGAGAGNEGPYDGN